MAVAHNLTIPLLVGNGITAAEATGIDNAEVTVAPAYEFQRDDNTVNWGAVVTYVTSEASITIPGMVDKDADGNDVVWLIRVTFKYRNNVANGGGGSQIAFIFAPAAGVDVTYPDGIIKQDVVQPPEYGPTYLQQAEAAKVAAQQAQVAAQGYAAAAQAVPLSNDTIIAGRINTPGSATATALSATIATLVNWAKSPDLLITGAITRNGDDVITTAGVKWPDGSPGTFTTDTIDASGAINAYHVTYGSPATKTFTQPAMTRNANGAVTALPAIVVS